MTNNRLNTIAILGAGGFIGSHLLERILSSTHYHIEAVDLFPRKIATLFNHDRLHFHRINVHEINLVRPIIEKSGTIISLTALCNPYLYTHQPIDVIESNFVKLYPLIQTSTEFDCRLIHFSTSEVYGRTINGVTSTTENNYSFGSSLLHETTTPLILGSVDAQRWCYASAKQLLERTIFAYGYEYELNYTIVRPFNFIGPGMDFLPGIDGDGVPRVLACFMDGLLHHKPLQLVDGGKNRRCFTAIEDAIDAIMLILEHPNTCRQRIFNIGNPDNETTIVALAARMITIFRDLLPECSDDNFNIENISSLDFYGPGYEDSDRRVPDISAITTAVGWQPKVNLNDALITAIKGFIKQYGR